MFSPSVLPSVEAENREPLLGLTNYRTGVVGCSVALRYGWIKTATAMTVSRDCLPED